MGWEFRPVACGKLESGMAGFGVQAGVVTDDQVEGLPSAPSGLQLTFSLPASWSYLWVGAAFAYLIMIYLGMIRVTSRG